MKDGVLHPTDVLVDGEPVVDGVAVESKAAVTYKSRNRKVMYPFAGKLATAARPNGAIRRVGSGLAQ